MRFMILGAWIAISFAPGASATMQAITDDGFRPVAFEGENEDAKVELGRFLFFDKILSGNENISCATCHHPLTSTSDDLSLPVGEGAAGLGIERDTGAGDSAIVERVPRNSPALFNLGAREYRVIFHDGRVGECADEPTGFCSPAGSDLPLGLDDVIAVQAMFPVTSATEMAGQKGENEIADFAEAGDLPALWGALADRLRDIPGYQDLFWEAYGISAEDITYVHAANAIAAFESKIWRADDSPFDRFLRGDRTALGSFRSAAVRGKHLFYGKAKCWTCHSGPLQTDHAFHSIAMPQLGPGKGDGPTGHEDFGREQVTGDMNDRFKFRTPTLRNVELTAPYGHAGAYLTLDGVIRHHLDPVASLLAYDRGQVVLAPRDDLDAIDFTLFDESGQPGINAIAGTNELAASMLSDDEVANLVAFMKALTDDRSRDLLDDVPDTVPSGLPVED